MNSIILLLICLSFCAVLVYPAPQYGGGYGGKQNSRGVVVSHNSQRKKGKTSSIISQKSPALRLPSAILTGNGNAAIIPNNEVIIPNNEVIIPINEVIIPNTEVIVPVIDCEAKNSSCTGEICFNRLFIIRGALLQHLNEDIFEMELKEADKMTHTPASINQLKFSLSTLKEKWNRIEKISLKMQELATNEVQLTAEVGFTEFLKDRINRMIFKAEQIIKRNTVQQPSCVDPKLTQLNNTRSVLIESMKKLLIEVEAAMSYDQSEVAKEIVNTRLEQEIWPQIVNLSLSITPLIPNVHIREGDEYKYQEELMKIHAKIQLTAKMRRCESPFETYFPAKKRCMKFESDELEGACPDNQVVLDGRVNGPNNRGLCACNVSDSTIMNRQDHQCYEQFTQGPCEEEDQWWVLNDAQNSGVCEVKPKDCPSDGKHVYWSPEDLDDSGYGEPHKQCYKLGERGPCPKGSTLVQLKLIVKCTTKDEDDSDMEGQESVFSRAPIAKGRNQCSRNNPKCV